MMPEPVLFQNMKSWVFYTATTLLYLLIVAGGMSNIELGFIFEIITAFSLSFLDFIWPGVFYIMAERSYGSPHNRGKRKLSLVNAWF